MLTQGELRRRLEYDLNTGYFTWRVGTRTGTVAGTIRRVKYGARRVVIGVKGADYMAHRLAFLYVTGSFPTGEIDHIDGDSLNNKWRNLRDVTRRINGRNCKQKANVSKSGEACVYWRPDRGYYQVRVRTTLKRVVVSRLATLEEAIEVRNNLWRSNDYHVNHNRK